MQGVFVVPAQFYPPPVSELELSTDHLASGQSLTVTHRCLPQGRGMLVDAYVLLRSEEGSVWSFDPTGAVVPGTVAYAEALNAGAAPVTTVVHSGPLGDPLDGPGTYTVEAILTAPGADPLDSSQILGWSGDELDLAQP